MVTLMNNEIDIKCPACGRVFQVTTEAYQKNEEIVCPPCDIVFRPQGNELANKAKLATDQAS